MMRTCSVSLAFILVARTPGSLCSRKTIPQSEVDIKDYSYFFIGQVKSSALRDLSTLMKTLAIKSLTEAPLKPKCCPNTPQRKVLWDTGGDLEQYFLWAISALAKR